ncbi:Gfo/Idh/MocA family protein [Treponema pectinovorum]|uniref:Gfo/Idh/MocA family protein n=1 Tax=Treponema pectinovorum TaxID=164 RepID=UPI0011F1DC93|nr:Gfo/Idh/MocA family oxidoreductase [Treponema pectinovorum]
MINLGIIGMGDMGSKYAERIFLHEELGFKITACTRVKGKNLERVHKFLNRGDIKIYDSDESFFQGFDDGEFSVDAVLIVTPHYSHKNVARAAFRRNLHVLCDKPAGVYLRQGREIVQARPTSKKLGFIFHQRVYPINLEIKKIIESGKYGKVKRLSYTVTDWFRTDYYYKSSPWRASYKTDGGGTLLNQCPHSLDLLCWLFGMPEKISGFCHEGKYHDIEVEDEATIYMEWQGGLTGVFTASTGENPGVNRLEISFDRALVTCTPKSIKIIENPQPSDFYKKMLPEEYKNPIPTTTELDFEFPPPDTYLDVFKAFADSINSELPLIATGEDALMSLYVSNAAYLSSAQKKQIQLYEIGSENELKFEKEFEDWLASKN